MNAKRPTNSELRLARLDDEDSQRKPARGILELFRRPKQKPDEDGDSPSAGTSASAEPPPPGS